MPVSVAEHQRGCRRDSGTLKALSDCMAELAVVFLGSHPGALAAGCSGGEGQDSVALLRTLSRGCVYDV